MRLKKAAVSLAAAAMLFTALTDFSSAEVSTVKDSKAIPVDFEQHKRVVILEELRSAGIPFDDQTSLQGIKSNLELKSKSNIKAAQVLDKIQQLENADYVYLDSETGDVYSSNRGYLGKAKKYDEFEEPQAVEDKGLKKDQVQILSKSNPTVQEIFGGNTGAFERRQLNFSGFDGIIANVTLPTVEYASNNVGLDEQAWVYYGFDPSSGSGVEGGYSYQRGRGIWLPYIRSGGFAYADEAYKKNPGDVVNNLKFYLKKASSSATTYTAYLIVGATEVKFASTSLTSITTTSVKRVTSIAKAGFDGTNIVGKSLNQKWDSVQVSLHNSDYYYSWGSYSEYSYWDTTKNMWYGTIDCIPSYIHRSNGYVSIYK